MAYYDALIAAWNSATQPPTGVTGTALTAQMTTAQKIAVVNGWTVAGTGKMLVSSTDIYNCIVPSEWTALTAANQQLIRDIFSLGMVDASAGTNARTVLLNVFGAGTTTRTNLQALAAAHDTPAEPFWSAPVASHGAALIGPVNMNDCASAGLS